ncbi:MAG TPA: helix-turn-helix transcriptional regulator, partial [Microbacterium sp.]|nr:helix-turn-helix transcriptional regulator [Microbacterium sp.]
MSAIRTRSSDQALVEQAVVTLARNSPHTVAFGGLAHDGAVHVSAIFGEHAQSIEGLVVREHRGLGGRAMVESRPRLALDYRTSRTITHDYDAAILGARIVTLVAVPVVVSGRPRGMLYCGSRRSAPTGGA